jgi:hypothetical protein
MAARARLISSERRAAPMPGRARARKKSGAAHRIAEWETGSIE